MSAAAWWHLGLSDRLAVGREVKRLVEICPVKRKKNEYRRRWWRRPTPDEGQGRKGVAG
ncbi:MAG: hypothetical protein L0Y44_10645 [Phycisphaerales bacterium]|nr:hypothetical protein [Phycisphaerales bacterium]MCI0675446.1 hypothetical protein [Phycisphaerales bacterium]